MKQYEQLKIDIKKILVDMALKGEFDGADLTCFDTSKLNPAFKKHTKRIKDNVTEYSMVENHDDEGLYNKPMVPLSVALGINK
jgi:hypothetical protein